MAGGWRAGITTAIGFYERLGYEVEDRVSFGKCLDDAALPGAT
jgi:hypothetical protein